MRIMLLCKNILGFELELRTHSIDLGLDGLGKALVENSLGVIQDITQVIAETATAPPASLVRCSANE
jgi:hypothetical protein